MNHFVSTFLLELGTEHCLGCNRWTQGYALGHLAWELGELLRGRRSWHHHFLSHSRGDLLLDTRRDLRGALALGREVGQVTEDVIKCFRLLKLGALDILGGTL